MKAKHLKNIFTFLPILLTIVLSSTIYAQTWTQRGGDICGEAISDFSGWSIALNSDGTKFLVNLNKYNVFLELISSFLWSRKSFFLEI